MATKEKMKVLEVTTTRLYYIPMIDEERSKINGWTIEQIIEDWFGDTRILNSPHATRHAYGIGYSKRFVDAKIVDPEEG